MDDKLTYADMVAEAERRGFRVERGEPSRIHGMRSGYILWAFGLWSRYGSLYDLQKAMERKGYDYKALRAREKVQP